MDMLDKVKKSMRISHNKLDDILLDDIETAKEEMIRAGVSLGAVNVPDRVTEATILAYCMWKNAPDKDRDRAWESWVYHLDNVRKSTIYKGR